MTNILNARVLLAVAAIVAVAALALGATYAAWQATDSISGNTVSTASLSITAAGAAAYSLDASPIEWENALPGETSAPANRAEITNNSSIALDLYMYLEPVAGTCTATKLAWRSGVAGSGIFDYGYLGAEPTNVGTKAGAGDDNFELVGALAGVANHVMVADSTKFVPGAVIALQEIAGIATDADYPADAGTCEWTEVFVGTLPGELPV